MTGKLIILNGTSSSGKSSIARKLQKEINENYLVLGVDIFMKLMPEKFANVKNKNAIDQEIGFSFSYDNLGNLENIILTEIGYRYIASCYKAVLVFLDSGFNVIYDDMIFNDQIYRILLSNFSKVKYSICLISCNEELRKDRELSRRDRIKGTYLIGSQFINSSIFHDHIINNESDLNTATNQIKKLL